MKAADVPSLDELRSREASLDLDGNEQRRQQTADEFVAQLLTAMGGTNGDKAKTLRDRADKTARQFGPIEIETFDA
jgi:hypothetical protein